MWSLRLALALVLAWRSSSISSVDTAVSLEVVVLGGEVCVAVSVCSSRCLGVHRCLL